ncbi:hypothetical protein EHS39_13530 [Ensifer sp. MPMI2T]|nr:hypothetical protein EHS39_13530 [Ensifer sp. MPMI2T]
MSEPYKWIQHLPPFVAYASYQPKGHDFLVEVEDCETGRGLSALVPATYMPRFGIDVQDADAIHDKIAGLIEALKRGEGRKLSEAAP